MSADPSLGRAERVRRPRRVALVVTLILFLALIGGAAWAISWGVETYRTCTGRADGTPRPVTFTVEEGATGQQVVDALHERGVIPCGGFVGGMLLRGTGMADRIRAGEFQLTTAMTLDQAIQVLTAPPPKVPTVELVIPEGYRLTQIADRARSIGISASRFLQEAGDGSWSLPPYLPARARSIEGFLFPKSYEFVKADVDARTVIREMLDQFRTEAQDLPFGRAKALKVTPYQVVIIASMIEEEARVDRDRRLIAGVIYNRLRLGMTLGIDATLLYDDPTPDGQLSSSDLESNSPYNTRLHAGLPPTPIASPGAESLLAALTPAHTEYLFYVLCGADGHHRFARTEQEHLQNVDACLG